VALFVEKIIDFVQFIMTEVGLIDMIVLGFLRNIALHMLSENEMIYNVEKNVDSLFSVV